MIEAAVFHDDKQRHMVKTGSAGKKEPDSINIDIVASSLEGESIRMIQSRDE